MDDQLAVSRMRSSLSVCTSVLFISFGFRVMLVEEEEEEEEEDDEQNTLLQPHTSMTLGTIPTYYISTAILVISPLEKTHNEVCSLS